MADEERTYCYDTSSFIQLRYYPRRTFPGVWNHVEQLLGSGRIVSPDEVLRELERGGDDIFKWAKRHRDIFHPVDEALYADFREVVDEFPALVDEKEESPDADAFVVSVARLLSKGSGSLFGPPKIVVVTEEVRSRVRKKIPDACTHYGIDCVDLFGFFELEGLEFS